jgi:acetylornithine/N-succinyldiaminopimelate aminotransferase
VIAVLRDEKLVEAAETRGEKLGRGLADLAAKHPTLCANERGRGLLRGIVLAPAADPRATLAKIRDHGVLLTIAGNNVLRFSPPLILRDEEIDEAIERVDAALSELDA